MIRYFMTKPTKGAAFNRFWDHLMGSTESQDPGPVKPQKDCEEQVSKYGQKVARNAAPDQN